MQTHSFPTDTAGLSEAGATEILDLSDGDGQWHARGGPRFQAGLDGLADVGQGLVFGPALGDTAGYGRTLGDDHAGFIPIQAHEEFHHDLQDLF